MKVGSYASVLKGREKSKMSGKNYRPHFLLNAKRITITWFRSIYTDSDKFRDLHEAIEYPARSMFEEVQFPPVTAVRAEWQRKKH